MSTFDASQLEIARASEVRVRDIIRALEALPRTADIAHALIKLEAAQRGLADAIQKAAQ